MRRQEVVVSVFLFVIAISVRTYVALQLIGQYSGDVQVFQFVADTIRVEKSIYAVKWEAYWQPPGWTWMLIGLRVLADYLGLSFDFMVKIPCMLADGLISAFLYIALLTRGKGRHHLGWCMLYALNPVSIYVSSIVGQIESLVIGLLLLGAILIRRSKSFSFFCSAMLCLGFAIAVKMWAVIFVPFFVWEFVRAGNWKWSDAVLGLTLVSLPWLLQMLPFFLAGESDAYVWSLRYFMLQSGSGGVDMKLGPINVLSWIGIPITGLSLDVVPTPDSWVGLDQFMNYILDRYRLLLLSKLVFACVFLVVVVKGRSFGLAQSILLSFLLIYVFMGGYFGYYLVWLLPFAVMLQQKALIPYTMFALMVNLHTHRFTAPNISLPGFFSSLESFASGAHIHPWINFGFWCVCAIWLARVWAGTSKQSAVDT
ncbi:MAG: hypothetical protein QGG60_01835 [Anaerolineales bacterium]|jgi:hypothetical protein|nr:hypothetical protein [Anaerolineales bacterium]|tara:strand:+ start:5791 stop:7065 length:1275 start_codon:yes stop_codon:yes gene_type:complete